MVKLRIPEVEFGSNPFRFIGASYTVASYASEKRPLLRLNFVFFVVWVRLPFEHYRPRRRDLCFSATISLRRSGRAAYYMRDLINRQWPRNKR